HSEELRRHTHYNIGCNVCHLICSRYNESPQRSYGEYLLLFALHFLCSAIHQGHRRLVAAVNFGHKKTQLRLGRCVGYLSVVMY
ncbi:hypothetical protein OFN62_30625, partial [Escherichia coli]|nr:hypothetical protein [Escherichia coli]